MANIRMSKKINEIISQYKAKIYDEKFQAVKAISNDRKLVERIVGWMDYSKTVGKSFVNFYASNYDDWDSAITFYCGKKPKDLDYCHFNGSYKVSKNILEFLKNYKESNLTKSQLSFSSLSLP